MSGCGSLYPTLITYQEHIYRRAIPEFFNYVSSFLLYRICKLVTYVYEQTANRLNEILQMNLHFEFNILIIATNVSLLKKTSFFGKMSHRCVDP
jgi:hypothetical protein